ncbi:DUF4349 domain-containing protein [Kitasatospora sp. NPDC092948]|uniref:DUF4349 domain-containing protein n=1 Tax=Kitasatospora sp. NPDC092948 TaxID=3364088 RepID=UPI003806FA02
MGVRVRRAGAAGVLAAVLLLAGCSAGGGTGDSAAAGKAGNAAPAVAPAAGGKAAGAGGAGAVTAVPSAGASGQPVNRQIAYQARMTVKVDALEAARDRAVDLVGQAGGYVAGESRRAAGAGAADTLTLKVPSESYQRTVDALAGLGQQLTMDSQSEDLTGQIADVDSRITSMRASVDRVRALMADARTLADVVSLESELTRRESDLESLEHQQQELTSRTSLSTVTLDLLTDDQRPTGAVAEHKDGFWASVGHALRGGWHALVAVLHGLLVVLAAGAPFLLVLAPLAWLLLRRRRTHPRRPRPSAPVREDFPAPPQQPPTAGAED